MINQKIKMKAAVLYRLNSPLVIENLEIPTELDVGQVLVRIVYSSICGAQINEIFGAKGEDKFLPHLLGHEGSGIVIAVGPGVTQVKMNDNVVLHWRKGKGINSNFPKYKTPEDTIIGGGLITTFNEYAIVSENRLTVFDEDIPSDIAALMGCATTTGLGIIDNEAHLKMGQSIMVAGCGGVGLNVIMGASLSGAYPIIGLDISKEKSKFAEKFGATDTFANLESKYIKHLEDIDIFVDCTGIPEIIEAGYTIAKKTILVGQPKINENLIFNNMRTNYTGKIMMDSQGGLSNPNEDIPRYLNLYKVGKLKLNEMITKRIRLQDINDVIFDMRENKFLGKCIIEI